MRSPYVAFRLPDAKRDGKRCEPAVVRELVKTVQHGARVTRAEIAARLGIAPNTLASYMTEPEAARSLRRAGRRASTTRRRIPYATLFCLEMWAANLAAAAEHVFSRKPLRGTKSAPASPSSDAQTSPA